MAARDVTLSEVERLQSNAIAEEVAFQMDEDSFRAFYERTSRPLWTYLSRISGDSQMADDLLQEAYYRFLRVGGSYQSEAHRRNYLFRIGLNLVRDDRRRSRGTEVTLPDDDHNGGMLDTDTADRTERATDLSRAMALLKPRERALLWLAYAQGSSHREIAEAVGVKTPSVKLLLFRARRRLAALLRGTRTVREGSGS